MTAKVKYWGFPCGSRTLGTGDASRSVPKLTPMNTTCLLSQNINNNAKIR